MGEATFFSNVKHKFQPLSEDGRIDTDAFLSACGEVIPFFDVLGSTAFAPVKSDINGNITKLRKKFLANPAKFTTLQAMVEDEIEQKTTKSKGSATDALLWLKRALTFIRILFEQVLTNEPDLSKCVTAAYEGSLKKYHGWMVQKVFGMAMMAVPYRKDFLIALGKDASEKTILEHMQLALDEMAVNLDQIIAFYIEKGEDKEGKV